MAMIDEERAGDAIAWAQRVMADGLAEEYALAATTLEDAYIRFTGHTFDNGTMEMAT
jgi:ABC-2 type transport system ATP-binding protein